jgi:hypothetical protein
VTEEDGGDSPARRSYPKGARRRQLILQSAIVLFAQRGVDSASNRCRLLPRARLRSIFRVSIAF